MNFQDSRDLYQDIILDRGRNPRHRRALDPFDAQARGDNPMCGDQIEVRVKFAPDQSVAEAAYEGRGCAIMLASADLMAEAAHGHDAAAIRALAAKFAALARTGEAPDGAENLSALQVFAGVSEYPSRVKCATLPWTALIAALDAAQETPSGE